MIAKVLGYQGIPTTRTVREVYDDGEWMLVDDIDLELLAERGLLPGVTIDVRERTVVDPIYVVPQMLPCPECEGCGAVGSYRDAIMFGRLLKTCPRCLGSGVVAPPWPDYIATEEFRISETYTNQIGLPNPGWHPKGTWESLSGWVLDGGSFQRRQVVAYKVTATEPLPVVAGWTGFRTDRPPELKAYPDGQRVIHPWNGGHLDVTDEPWAADLTPGQVVWRLHLEALDQPYTEMVIGHPESTRAAVPLSVPVGEVTDVELTR